MDATRKRSKNSPPNPHRNAEAIPLPRFTTHLFTNNLIQIIMSCIPVNIDSLVDVREMLYYSAGWREQTDNKPLQLWLALTGDYDKRSETAKIAVDFVEKAYIFNAIECFCGKHAKSNTEPEQWNDALQAMKNVRRYKLIPIMQLFKSLQFIDYNTDVAGWLTPEEYENWSRKDEYEQFKDTCARLRKFLAEFIVSRLPEYQAAKWG